ncbi:MAG: hypothetical protein ABIZ36_10735 [Gemmatimonadaceae bacterium]
MIRKFLNRLLVGIIVASIWAGAPTTAQAQKSADKATDKSTTVSKTDPVVASGDSVSIADVERAAEDLAMAVQAAVKKATEDPAFKVAALKVATNAVNAAQVVVTQQAATLQAVLDSLAKEIAMATAKQTKAKSH